MKTYQGRYEYFNVIRSFRWGELGERSRAEAATEPFVIMQTHEAVPAWEVFVPKDGHLIPLQGFLIEQNYKLKLGFGEWSDTHFKTFRNAFKAVKELQQLYATLPVKVRTNDGADVIIGNNTTEEVAAILTYT